MMDMKRIYIMGVALLFSFSLMAQIEPFSNELPSSQTMATVAATAPTYTMAPSFQSADDVLGDDTQTKPPVHRILNPPPVNPNETIDPLTTTAGDLVIIGVFLTAYIIFRKKRNIISITNNKHQK